MKITKRLAQTLKAALGKKWREKVRKLDFRDANFRGANFGDANFGDANFGDANFGDANFGDANFRDANFDNYEKIHLIMLANACVYPLKVTVDVLKEAKKKQTNGQRTKQIYAEWARVTMLAKADGKKHLVAKITLLQIMRHTLFGSSVGGWDNGN